jgi:hypothetical protein
VSIDEGHFRVYPNVVPDLKAGDYRFRVSHGMAANPGQEDELGPTQLPVDELLSHVRVTSPRFVLSPDQILSTFPPAGTDGAYGSRLPQVVIKRRTLPWERTVDGASEDTPWLVLVVYAEGEADLQPDTPVAQCVSTGVTLDGPSDAESATCLVIRTSMVDRIMPTQLDVRLLAHAREVNIDDTELMMGDDDGWLAVVIANRLPLPSHGPDGKEIPVTYHACLINIEGQFEQLLPKAPPTITVTRFPEIELRATYSAAQYDHIVMDGVRPGISMLEPPGINQPHASAMTDGALGYLARERSEPAVSATVDWSLAHAEAVPFDTHKGLVSPYIDVIGELIDTKLRFPVLLHWSFISSGSDTFESLMTHVDSGMMGTLKPPGEPLQGRPEPEVVETGHVGLTQRTRRGDVVRAWYRGPLLPHPSDGSRLDLAHASDQLRVVISDGREDLSLASAFEIGRLLALSRPSIVAALLQWRQTGYQSARSNAIWKDLLTKSGLLDEVGFEGMQAGRILGTTLGRQLVQAVAANPLDAIGPPRELHTAGTPMEFDGEFVTVVAKGFGMNITAKMNATTILKKLIGAEVPSVALTDLTRAHSARLLSGTLGGARDITALSIAESVITEEPS